MKVLWVATKAPWPPVDGGRLLLWNTLGALSESGVEITLVAPYLGAAEQKAACEERLREVCRPELVTSRLRSGPFRFLLSILTRKPWTLLRHDNPKVRRRVAAELAIGSYDVVVAEQVQALNQVPGNLETPPMVLRAQNVESDLWLAMSQSDIFPGPFRWFLRHQAGWLADAEGRAVGRCAAAAALTDHDAKILRELADTCARGSEARPRPTRVEVVPAVVSADLGAGQPLEGDPSLVLFGSAGWQPNVEGARAFLQRAWPSLRERQPEAVLHLFGELLHREASDDARVHTHAAPVDSATALAEGSILVVPLDVASGVRMKILEAWARGVPVVASSAAARGLVAEPGRELEVVESSGDWAGAVARCVENADGLRDAARRRLRQTYSAEAGARRWTELFRELARR